MTGFGADYRGCQNLTKKGFVCMPWDVDLPHNMSRIPGFEHSIGNANYCRNPDPYELPNRASIWCMVNDSGYYTFDYCSSIGEPVDYHLHPHQCVYYTERKGKTTAGGRYVLGRSTRYKSRLQHTIYFYDKRTKFFEDIDQGRKEPGDNVDVCPNECDPQDNEDYGICDLACSSQESTDLCESCTREYVVSRYDQPIQESWGFSCNMRSNGATRDRNRCSRGDKESGNMGLLMIIISSSYLVLIAVCLLQFRFKFLQQGRGLYTHHKFFGRLKEGQQVHRM